MSNDTWESGTITLPPQEFDRVHAAVLAVERSVKERVRAQSQEFWRGLTRKQRTDPEAYRHAVREHYQATLKQVNELSNTPARPGSSPTQWAQSDELQDDADALGDLLLRVGYDKPRRVLVTDLPLPTARTMVLPVDSGATITFDRKASTVRWDSGWGNNQAEVARRVRGARALFAALRQVRWAPGTGGVITGNDEYSQRELRREDYAIAGYGPLGSSDPHAAHLTPHWKPATGFYSGAQGRVPSGVSTGGQFAHRSRSESDVRL
ncbi:hypothetical protein [Pseudactinotalea terrae]|uniref:hypothetical protein n=1 Tax=Pseudactinotalea terrae TaxID=1743262 RepID=UPI0012E30D5C|nr:hypothetical protein [Pseudactinotalea terrae]